MLNNSEKRDGRMPWRALERACLVTFGKKSEPRASKIDERFWNMEAFEEYKRYMATC